VVAVFDYSYPDIPVWWRQWIKIKVVHGRTAGGFGEHLVGAPGALTGRAEVDDDLERAVRRRGEIEPVAHLLDAPAAALGKGLFRALLDGSGKRD
jgi:hypothetical protein